MVALEECPPTRPRSPRSARRSARSSAKRANCAANSAPFKSRFATDVSARFVGCGVRRGRGAPARSGNPGRSESHDDRDLGDARSPRSRSDWRTASAPPRARRSRAKPKGRASPPRSPSARAWPTGSARISTRRWLRARGSPPIWPRRARGSAKRRRRCRAAKRRAKKRCSKAGGNSRASPNATRALREVDAARRDFADQLSRLAAAHAITEGALRAERTELQREVDAMRAGPAEASPGGGAAGDQALRDAIARLGRDMARLNGKRAGRRGGAVQSRQFRPARRSAASRRGERSDRTPRRRARSAKASRWLPRDRPRFSSEREFA